MAGPRGDEETWAGELARRLLEVDATRWRHVRAVAAKAGAVGARLDAADRSLLVASAHLHDIGYAPEVRRTGFHPLDGALHLRALGRDRLAGLVANHSGAAVEAESLGLVEELRGFPDEGSDDRDLLWYCDLTTGPDGEDVSLSGRFAGVVRRYGADHAVTRSFERALPVLGEAVARAESRIASAEG